MIILISNRQMAPVIYSNHHQLDHRQEQDAPGQMTWLEDPPLWLRPPRLLLCFASVIVRTENKNFTISDR